MPEKFPDRPITLMISAIGGEGGGVLANWIVAAARHSELEVQATSIPGVAQRTGATVYYLEIYPVPQNQLKGNANFEGKQKESQNNPKSGFGKVFSIWEGVGTVWTVFCRFYKLLGRFFGVLN